ncbi:HIR1_1 [Sanghuangporus weigelae]
MKFTKLSWVMHQGSRRSQQATQVALHTYYAHWPPVLTVHWAHSGCWLESGSDDEIIMIWDLDPTGSGKALKAMLQISLRLQRSISLLQMLIKLDMHQGFVKGVCWDPVGEFLATQSDDRTVCIWRTTDWCLEATVTKPFECLPGSTFFHRLSWSPNGAHTTASNATNNNGYVFTAAIVLHNAWMSDISLVGYENTVEVACYNTHIFLRNPQMLVVTSNICSVVAPGADDRSISIWQMKSTRPIIVAKEVFERQIMDLSWYADGRYECLRILRIPANCEPVKMNPAIL